MNFEQGWTPEYWEKIPPLRQLDAWLAWHLFGFRWWLITDSGCRIRVLVYSCCGEETEDMSIQQWESDPPTVRDYSTDWGAMGLVVEAMLEKGYRLSVNWEQVDFEVWTYVVRFHPHKLGEWGSGKEIPEAVCRAAQIVLEQVTNA